MLAGMPQSWSDSPVVDVAPDLATHERLDDVTWPVLTAWVAGPDWVVATSDRAEREPVVRSSAEIDDGLDRELSMVGLPPRPRGYDWYLRLDVEGLRGGASEQEHLRHVYARMSDLVPEALLHAIRPSRPAP
jgi:hypothetical protein